MIDPMAAGGLLVLGVVLGVLLMRWAGRITNRELMGNRKCALCGQEGYVVACKKCGKEVAMCHYYGILYPDEPGYKTFGKRRSTQVCTGCIPAPAREAVDGL